MDGPARSRRVVSTRATASKATRRFDSGPYLCRGSSPRVSTQHGNSDARSVAARCATWVENGTEVTPFYDPMLAKIIIRADMRDAAVQKLREALAFARFDGLETNLDYLRRVIAEPKFSAGGFPTTFLNAVVYC